MGLKKACCPICHKGKEYFIFEVNPEAEVCYCPHCLGKLKPSEAIKTYDNFIGKLLKKAEIYLFQAIDFEKAYRFFAKILEYDNTYLPALYGRLLCLLYMSRVTRARFDEFCLLFKSEKPLFQKSHNRATHLIFLHRVLHAVNEYEKRLFKKFTVMHYFYDVDCIKLYFKRLNEIYAVKEIVKNEYLFFSKTKDETFGVEMSLLDVTRDLTNIKKRLQTKAMTVDGFNYGYVGTSLTGGVLLNREETPRKVKINRLRPHGLNLEKKGKKKPIAERVFPYHLPLCRLGGLLTYVSPVLFILTILGLISSFFVPEKALIGVIITTVILFLLTFGVVLFKIIVYQKLKLTQRAIK